jgi:hypothetical protein
MYENGKMRPDETIIRMEGSVISVNAGGSASKIYCKHFCKCHNVPPVQQ